LTFHPFFLLTHPNYHHATLIIIINLMFLLLSNSIFYFHLKIIHSPTAAINHHYSLNHSNSIITTIKLTFYINPFSKSLSHLKYQDNSFQKNILYMKPFQVNYLSYGRKSSTKTKQVLSLPHKSRTKVLIILIKF
jgi:hypothetical protein